MLFSSWRVTLEKHFNNSLLILNQVKKKNSSYWVGGVEHLWFSELLLVNQGGVCRRARGGMSGWEEGDLRPDLWKNLHVACPASGLEYGATKGYVQSLGCSWPQVEKRGGVGPRLL